MSKVLSSEEIEAIRKTQRGILKQKPEVKGQLVFEAVQNLLATIDQLQADKGICIWKEDVDMSMWETSCGEAFCFIEDGIEENNFKYCPLCGKEIEELKESEDGA